MQIFDISWAAIFKVTAAGLFSYVVFPILLVIRDLLLHKAIGTLILTKGLTNLIVMCESDRFQLKNNFNKNMSLHMSTESTTYKLDGVEVSEKEYLEYEKNRNFHINRFELANSKIGLRHNLITWLTQHYKLEKSTNPIPAMREKYYALAERRELRS